MRKCKFCATPFQSNYRRAVYCKKHNRVELRKEPKETGTCEWCEITYKKRNSLQRYCKPCSTKRKKEREQIIKKPRYKQSDDFGNIYMNIGVKVSAEIKRDELDEKTKAFLSMGGQVRKEEHYGIAEGAFYRADDEIAELF